ncbi:proline dehydrogenase family protein [Corynebacterium glutamicum]|uniref:proline dehydrogenase family protein n=1 Tax=Corynebacterium glutamicum TaxID=1718 RepID=UPI0014681B9B|nr:proline dehydrogenase family protein [Corynebacterium glutamicum]GFK20505.1 hypothetical protein KbCgl_30770 [Corynebacterium glutamicum]
MLQAYLPDALGAIQDLAEFGRERVNTGGAGVKVRLVKGANLPMEYVHAQITGWPVATEPSKQATDANYKRVLYWTMRKENMEGCAWALPAKPFRHRIRAFLSVERGVPTV